MRRYLQDTTMPQIFQFLLLLITIQFNQTYANEIQGCQLFTIKPENLKYENLYYQNSIKQGEHNFRYHHSQYIDKNDIISDETNEIIGHDTFEKIKGPISTWVIAQISICPFSVG